MGVKLLSFPLLLWWWWWWWCASLVLLRAVSENVSGLFASKAKPFPHDFFSFLGGHRVDVHRIQIFLAMIKIEPSRSFVVRLLVVRVGSRVVPSCSVDGALHPYEIVLELYSPFVPFVECCRGSGKRYDLCLNLNR